MKRRNRLVRAALVVAIAALPGCRRGAPERRYALDGKVVAIDRTSRRLTVSHREIPGFMPAMTMTFEVEQSPMFENAAAGDTISADLIVSGRRSRIAIVSVARGPSTAQADAQSAGAKPGDALPDLGFVDERGEPIRLRETLGRPLLVTFVYTRCPLPDYCPLMSRNFAQIENVVAGDPQRFGDARLLSVTLDPEFDTPAVLARYRSQYERIAPSEPRRWRLATGRAEDVRALADFFGLQYVRESGQIAHSLVAGVFDGRGRVVRLHRGNDWTVRDVLGDLERLTRTAP